ncbi:hypothetical protein V2K52_25545 [Pseudomonas alliivorans]|nr:hypothetical protein [Pseudomonas alliivorans]MEE4795903.1 hypothetical protein [Pseudomonas alliivorans]MEE4800930.1 hypothetical protein [Pseudomonas alliivorans]MEE4810975.1 hypothetical protein [Pseudomonas alliivorans]MEE4826154.1 hypothetical protein [Pseudomonas alliivorans]
MHEYVVSYHDRKKIYYIAAIVSGLACGLLVFLVSQLNSLTGFAIVAPSGAVVFVLVFLVFDLWIWKFKLLYDWGMIKIPNIHGDWVASIIADPSGQTGSEKAPIGAKLKIHQSYTRLAIRLKTEKSESISQMASLEMVSPDCFKLRYEYLASYRANEHASPSTHYGVTELTLESSSNTFDAEYSARYYTESDRDSRGNISISRELKNE